MRSQHAAINPAATDQKTRGFLKGHPATKKPGFYEDVTLRDLGEATAEDLQTQLQLPRPMARRMQKYFAGEMAQEEAWPIG